MNLPIDIISHHLPQIINQHHSWLPKTPCTSRPFFSASAHFSAAQDHVNSAHCSSLIPHSWSLPSSPIPMLARYSRQFSNPKPQHPSYTTYSLKPTVPMMSSSVEEFCAKTALLLNQVGVMSIYIYIS